MTEIPLNCWSESDQSAIREQLDRVLKSGPFHQSQRRQRFLEYLVNETLAGRGGRLKAYTIAVEVFERPQSFDPLVDPLVRVEAGRLRDKLREYYEVEGSADAVRIDLPKGSYAPHIELQRASPVGLEPEPAQQRTAGAEPVAVGHESEVTSTLVPAEGDPVRGGPRFQRPTGAQPPWMKRAVLAAVVLAIILAGLWGMNKRNAAPSLVDKASIAVLPFDSIGDDPQWERFADGITEDIIADLSHFRNLSVIARNSTGAYKGKTLDVRRIGSDLDVKYVLEGSIQSAGEQIRVTAQLIEAESGSHVWSERYDRPADHLFEVQSDVSEQIATTLGVYQGAIAEAERRLVRRKAPASLTAYDTYLLAVESKHKVTKEGLFEAERLLRKALEIDPQLARAYVALVDVQCYLIDLGLAPSMEEALSKMMDAGRKAVQLDPNDGKAHLALGFAYAYHRKPELASAEFARAEALAPSDADVLVLIALSVPMLGQSERAVSLAEKSLKLNPHYPDWYNQALSLVFFFGEQYERSLKYRLLVKEPFAVDYAFLAMANAYLGRTSDAETAAANVKKLDPTWTAERYLSEAGGYAEKEAALFVDGARKAGLSDCVPVEELKDLPNLIHVKSCDQRRAKTSG
jgi:TolB-like protein